MGVECVGLTRLMWDQLMFLNIHNNKLDLIEYVSIVGWLGKRMHKHDNNIMQNNNQNHQ